MLRVVAFVPYPLGTAPSQRFRLEQWASHLRTQDISLKFRPFASPDLVRLLYRPGLAVRKLASLARTILSQIRHMPSPDDFDVAVVHRGMSLIGPAVSERLLVRRTRLVYDFDDAIHLLHTSDANRAFGWLKFPTKTGEICSLADAVTVGNEYLAAFARKYSSDVNIVPSSVDTALYTPGPMRTRAERPVIGWMGSSTSQTYLEPFGPLLSRMVAAGLCLRIVSDRRPTSFDFPFEWSPWSAATEVFDLQSFDVGIMPLPDTEWARGKCAMKLLQYMGVGVPSIGSSLGGNLEVIQDGENGFLADTHDEWFEKTLRLASDLGLARRLGAAGRETVVARYSAAVCAARFGDVLYRVAERPIGRLGGWKITSNRKKMR